ncbi:MAG: hypothetical protein V8R46_04115 [Eubacterium ramulus]
MKLEMDLKPKDIVLLKVLGCVLIAFVMIRFLIFPGIEKHMDLVDQRDEVVAEQEDMQALIDRKDTFDAIIANQQSSLKSAQEGYYDLLENREVDELITGIVLNHNLFPVYLNITDTTAGVPEAYLYAPQAATGNTSTADSSADTSTDATQDSAAADSTDSSDSEDSATESSAAVSAPYVNTTSVDVTIRGSEAEIKAFLDDIARNYPGIQVRTFNMQENDYVNTTMQTVSEMSCSCTLAVYVCGEQQTAQTEGASN